MGDRKLAWRRTVFIDLIKAFDSISREALFAILRRYGIPDHFLNIIIRLHSDAMIKIEIPGAEEDVVVASTIGVRQGSTEGPVLFLFFIQAMFDTLEWPTDEFQAPMEPLQFTSIQHPHERGVKRCEFPVSDVLFADDCGLFFKTYRDLVIGTTDTSTYI